MSTIALVEVLLTLRRCDYNWLCRDVLVASASRGLNGCNLIDHIHSLYDFSKYGIAETSWRLVGMVEEVIVHQVDEELAGSTVNDVGSCHCESAPVVRQRGRRLVLDLLIGGFLHHVCIKAAALDHEARNYAMKD